MEKAINLHPMKATNMNHPIPLRTTSRSPRKAINALTCRGAFLLVALCLSLSAKAQGAGLAPPPDDKYANETTASGKDALFGLTTGYNNSAYGFNTLHSNTTGHDNTGIGDKALVANITGSGNTAAGVLSLGSNTGSFNI